ncbi:myb/SANT-like DNA-binding domain-containing protein 3 [Cephus cinctus]|uniref:Regulatory protein zeste n=1 Tax=Cephus cinctus TaxID=211228 RepID=A0AAJ7CF85_CEPCN|nr:myb/SANT-like DNA-binding domain-containing protein 3 [Cephus cinctus]
MEKTERKKRTSNFTEVEKIMLVDLINEKKHVIENKVTNSATIKEKEKCWEEITNKFNSASTFTYRDTQVLRNCWDNIKKRKRKYFADGRKEVLKTGGGQYHFEDNSLASKTREIIRSSVDGMFNDVDSDCISSAIDKENMSPSEDISFREAGMNETVVIDSLDDSKEYEVEYLPEYEHICLRTNEKEIDPTMNALEVKVSAGEKASNPSTSIDENKSTVQRNLIRKNQQLQRKLNRFYNTTVPKTTRESSNKKIAQFTKLTESKITLSEILAKNETEKHSIEMAIAEKTLIREKLEIDVLKTELEIKKTILMREKSKNAMLGIINKTE